MKMTVSALLLIALAFGVLAAIFRSGMKQFDQQYTPPVAQVSSPTTSWLNAQTSAPSKKRLQPWLRKATARRAPAEPAPAQGQAGVQPVSNQPAQDPAVTEEQLITEEEQLITEEELVAWHEELQAREAALLEAEAAQQAWLEEQAVILEEEQRWAEDQAALADAQEAINVQAWEEQAALIAAEEQQQQAFFEAERRALELEREWLRQQQSIGILESGLRRTGSPQAQDNVTQSQGGGRGFTAPIATSAPPISTSAPPIATSAPPIATSAPPIATSAPPIATGAPPINTRRRR